MSEKSKSAESTAPLHTDLDRAAYMIAWRDRYIAKLEEMLQGREEERSMLDCLLFYALFSISKGESGERREALIAKDSLHELLGAWKCHTQQVDGGYRVIFEAVKEGEGRGSDAASEKERP